MTSNNKMRTVYVNQEPVYVPATTTGAAVLRAAGVNPNSRDLVRDKDDGVIEMVPKNSRINTRDGERFESQIPSRGGTTGALARP